MQIKSVFLSTTILALFSSTTLLGSTEISCRKIEDTSQGRFSYEIKVYQESGGGYFYSAYRCNLVGRYCEGNEGDYQSYGPIERVLYNDHPTMTFKTKDISIFPLCGNLIMFRDNSASGNNVRAAFTFTKDECIIEAE